MQKMTAQQIQARLREIEEWLRDRESVELTQGWLGCGPDADELAELYQEREELLQELARAA